MEKHKQTHLEFCDSSIPKNKNIMIKTENIQQLLRNDIYIKKKVDDIYGSIKEEIIDLGYNTEEKKYSNSNFCTANTVTKSVNQFGKTIKIEKDVLNGCMFESIIENETLSINPMDTTLVTEKNIHSIHPIENGNNHHLTVSGELHNGEKQYQCNICNKHFHNKHNLEIHKSLNENIKKFKCISCDEQFYELNGLRRHLISHIDNNLKLLNNQCFQLECNDVSEHDSDLCNNITRLKGLNTSHFESGIPIQKGITNKVTLEYSIEIEQPNIEGIVPNKNYSIGSKNCVNSNLTVGNAANSCAPVNHEHVSLAESDNASHFESEVPIQKGITNKVTLEYSIETEQPNIEGIVPNKNYSIGSKNCVDSNLTVGNAAISYAIVNCEHDSLAESYNASSVDQKEHKNEKMYECAKCSKLFNDRPSIIDHLKPHTDQCANCCKYIGSQTSSKYPVSFQPGTPVYFECKECYNGFYTLKSFSKYLTVKSKKEIDRPYKCNVCLKTYINLYHFAAHQRLHKGERPYQCFICNKRFHARFNLEAHMFLHQNIKRFKCCVCSKIFLKLSYLKIHNRLSHKFSKNQCNICGKEFESFNSLQKHQNIHPGYKPHKCTECGQSFSVLKSFEQHLKRHIGLKPYKCTVCDESCSTHFDFMCHKRVHSGKMPYKCDICGDPFAHLTDWKKHRETHYDNKIFECNECHKKFGSKTGVKNHLQIHFEDMTKYKCKVCNKGFRKNVFLNQHELIHKKLKPFVCDICKKSFISRYNFNHHLRQHSGNRPYLCELCGKTYPAVVSLNRHKKINHTCDICDKFFLNPKELKAHKITHEESQLRQYACELCGKKSGTQRALNIHKLSHLVEKPFKCDICPKSFINTTVLSIHRRTHTGERPYACKLCNKTYPQISSLTRHVTMAHK